MNLAKKLRDLVNNNLVETSAKVTSDDDDYLDAPTPASKPVAAISQEEKPAPSPAIEAIALRSTESAPPAPEPGIVTTPVAEETLTPESVYQMLSSLPENLPMRVKRAAIRNAIQNQGKEQGADVEMILGEATWKKMQMTQQLKQFDDQHSQATQALNAEIEALLKRRDTINSEFDGLREEAITQMEQMDRVIQFLGTDLAGGPSATTFASGSGNSSELPPHLREETASRLLGISES
jgi:hypothetical protein